MQSGRGDRDARSGSARPPSPEDSEDFLFHLYRGSELLLDNRVHEAKDELEQALRLQPRDAKGQDLLAVVYFRLGMYPRAIGIYEDLVRLFPDDLSLSQNLALCYLKTSQAEKARELLEKIVAAQPTHVRAWSYLGLAYEKLGDYEKAKDAFAHGEQPGMARRMDGMITSSFPPHSLASMPPPMAGASFGPDDLGPDEITLPGIAPKPRGAGVLGRRPAVPITSAMTMPAPPETIEVTGPADLTPLAGSAGPAPQGPLGFSPVPTPAPRSRPPTTGHTIPGIAAPFAGAFYPGTYASSPAPQVLTAAAFTEEARMVFPADPGVALHPSGLVLVRVGESFGARLNAIRVMAPDAQGFKATQLPRRARMRPLDEPLGGSTTPMVLLTGTGNLALAPRPDQRLVPMRLDDKFVYVREAYLVGFEGTLSYENGRLAAFEGDAVAMVQIRGRGCIVVESPGPIASIEVKSDRPAVLARSTVLGWTGRLLPTELPAEEAPAGVRGLVSFAGEGNVMITAKAMPE
jgi:hypothetical protein